MLKDQYSFPKLHWEWVREAGFTPRSDSKCSSFPQHSMFLLNGMSGFCKFLLFLCHFSEVHFSLLQLHKRPITPTSDLLPLIGFPTAVAPFQRLHDLLLSTQSTAPRRHWQPGSRSFQWLILLPSQSKQLISNLSVIHHSSALNSPITFPSSTSEAR